MAKLIVDNFVYKVQNFPSFSDQLLGNLLQEIFMFSV